VNPSAAPTTAGHVSNRRHFRYYDLIMAGFVTVLLCSNMIGPGKVCQVELPSWLSFITTAVVFGAGNLFFPISYIFSDVLTEVYGYARSRRVIWAGFAAMLFYAFMAWVVIHLPASPSEKYNEVIQPALQVVFGNGWRIVLASIAAFWIGDFVNSFVMAKMKVMTQGRFLWARTIGSTMVGQGVDSAVFYPIAFAGLWTADTMLKVVIFNWLFKVAVEVVMTPLTYAIVGYLKRAENEDYFDTKTDFNPFTLKD